jgi:hypothetical protein
LKKRAAARELPLFSDIIGRFKVTCNEVLCSHAAFVLAITPIAQAQDQVVFKILFKPNTTYSNTTLSKSDVEFNVSGNEDAVEQLKLAGTFPMVLSMVNETEMETTTGPEGQDKNIPVKLVYKKVQNRRTINENETTVPNQLSGLIMEGYYDPDSKIHIDTMISSTLDQATKNLVRNTITSFQAQINFPETPLKKGDSFEQRVPIEMPLPGFQPIKMLIIMKYTLVDIRQNTAYFDLQQEVTLDMVLDKDQVTAAVTASGSGTGVCEFDMSYSALTKYESIMAMNMEVSVAEIVLKGTVNVKSTQLITIQ